MSFANFGIGVGAFARGMRGGIDLGREIKQVRNEKQVEDIRTKGMEAAKTGREADINAGVEKTGLDDRQDFMGDVTTGYKVGEKTYGNEGQAREQASRGVDSVMERFMTDTAPEISEAYVQQGNIEKAEAWNTWVQQDRSKRAVADWSKGYMAARSGNWDEAASGFGKYYTDYIDDGVEYKGHELVTDEGGNVTGFKIKLYDKDTDSEESMDLSTDELVTIGAAHNPQALFELTMQQQASADEARLETARDIAKDQRSLQNALVVEDFKQGNRLESETHKSNLRAGKESAAVNEKVRLLRGAGYTQEFIDGAMPAILGIGEYKKQASPSEVARMLYQERLKSDNPMDPFVRGDEATRRQMIQEDMQIIQELAEQYEGEKPGRRKPSGQGEGGGRSPAQGGLWFNPNTGSN